jgi:hypothetical protein
VVTPFSLCEVPIPVIEEEIPLQLMAGKPARETAIKGRIGENRTLYG